MEALSDLIPDQFDIEYVGDEGNINVVPKKQNTLMPSATLPFGLPPMIPRLKAQLEEFLTQPEKLPIYDLDKVQSFLPREPSPQNLLSLWPTPCQTGLEVKRDIVSGRLLGFEEVVLKSSVSTAKNSTSLTRTPGPPSEAISGNTTNYPFWPGGMDDITIDDLKAATNDNDLFNLGKDLLVVPPGFKNGMNFPRPDRNNEQNIFSAGKEPQIITLADIMAIDDDIALGMLNARPPQSQITLRNEDAKTFENEKVPLSTVVTPTKQEEELDSVISKASIPVLKIKSAPVFKVLEKTEWAEEVDISKPVENFKKLIPDMAYEWPFELDSFQKYAIMHLEQHNNVFVAAHTSAGKTVVAEYAIALSRKHMMKVIYTSPIKALSNQKFRDFHETFGDVGLITGDIKLKPDASCLIMTTEILRNMLYSGADTLRDLEWVIFDEVHYINDAERGVVWEEVLIMLPQHVRLVLLSATVPNHMEFADWIGRTKRSKIYVIKTQKRPVPLEHFLYTGNGGKSSNEIFMIVNDKGIFLPDGYHRALSAKDERSAKFQQQYGIRGPRSNLPPELEKATYTGLIKHLEKNNKLPAVCFTFSRKRCDDNAAMLYSLNLTSKNDKHEIRKYFKKYISRLQKVDQKLPQVVSMEELLMKGVAVHHSGILPILKEIVELLFQQGYVKLLFATETFAMGVNMPARTVVFDSIRKHDGNQFRNLLPSEYIQMAGRAGRRGLDKTGTVVIMAKCSVPESLSLRNMMLGKPTLLESQFRLTYRMLLNLLRVKDRLRVEDFMKRSFCEVDMQRLVKNYILQKENVEIALGNLPNLECQICVDVETYYQHVKQWEQLTSNIMKKVYSHQRGAKSLNIGNLIIIKTNYHQNVPAIILNRTSRVPELTVLALTEQSDWLQEQRSATSQGQLMPWTDEIFSPSHAGGHAVFDCNVSNIRCITSNSIPIEGWKVEADWSKRQQARFRDDPPGPTTVKAIQSLLAMTPKLSLSDNIVRDLPMKDPELLESCIKAQDIQNHLKSFACTHCPSLAEHFELVNRRQQLQEKLDDIKYWLSDESLHLAGDYGARKMVLRELKYIDENSIVQLKGRVACEMNQHELVLTELLFRQALDGYRPEEIAALLSCAVFPQNIDDLKSKMEKWPARLQQGIAAIEQIAADIETTELHHKVNDTVEETMKFGLANVVYEWAKGETFAHIMQMEDVTEGRQIQEGIVVRCIQRLDELLKDMRNGSKLVGDTVLAEKFAEASQKIRRDIVFAASLYTQIEEV